MFVWQEGGIKALYRGFTPTVIGMVPYAGIKKYSVYRDVLFFFFNSVI